MRKEAIILLLLIWYPLWGIGVDEARLQFHTMNTEKELNQFIKDVKELPDLCIIPYREAANMKRAKYAFNPMRKLKYFNEGKEKLEQFLKDHPNHLEGHYVRAILQSEVPHFLNYHDQLKNDVAFVNTHLDSCDLPDEYKELIRQTIDTIIQKNKL